MAQFFYPLLLFLFPFLFTCSSFLYTTFFSYPGFRFYLNPLLDKALRAHYGLEQPDVLLSLTFPRARE